MTIRNRLYGPVVFVGDIHGNLTQLKSLWGNIRDQVGRSVFDKLNLIFLGDYCDRGADTKGVVEFILNSKDRYPDQRHIYLCGNHDFGLQSFLKLGMPFMTNDYSSTHSDYVGKDKDEELYDGQQYEKMHVQGRRWGVPSKVNKFESITTFESYGAKHGDREDLLRLMPQHHKQFFSHLDWIADVETCVGNILAVHAGLEEQNVPQQIQRLKEKRCFDSMDRTLGWAKKCRTYAYLSQRTDS